MKKYNQRKCLYIDKSGTKKGIITGEYEEIGGKDDGQLFIIVKDIKTNEVKHIEIEQVQEILP